MNPAGTIVGRARELKSIGAALSDLADGRSTVVLVSGEPGIGKTRLTQELADRADGAGALVAWGRTFEAAATAPLWPWVQIIRAVLAATDEDTAATALPADAAEIVPVVPELKDLVADFDPSAHALGDASRLRLYDAVVGFLLGVAAARPLVLIVEDLHWADVPSLQLVELLAAELDEAPIVLVVTYRDVDIDQNHPSVQTLGTLARRPVLRIHLGGLPVDDVALVIAAVTQNPPEPNIAQAMYARTEGNPLFVTELARLLHREGQLSGGAALSAHAEVPAGVRDVIRQRLQGLPEEAVLLLRSAAAIGPEFNLDVLLAATDLQEDRAVDLLEECLEDGVVMESLTTPGMYRFSHALVRETLYRELTALRRARLHRRIGESILAVHGDAGDRAIELAHHFWEARAAGAADRALLYAEQAAKEALNRLAYELAEEQLTRCRQLVEGLSPGPERAQLELRLHLLLKTVLSITHGFATAELERISAAASELARDLGDARNMVASLWGMWVYRCVAGQLGSARELAQQLLDLATKDDDDALLLAGHYAAGVTAWHQGRLVEARDHLERAVARADAAPPDLLQVLREYIPEVSTRTFLALVLCLLGDQAEADRRIREARELAQRAGPYSVTVSHLFDAWLGVFRREPSHTRRVAGEAIGIARQHDFGLWIVLSTILHGWASAAEGDGDGAIPAMEGSVRAMDEFGARMLRHFVLGLIAESHWRTGDRGSALTVVEQAIAEADAMEERFYEAELHRIHAEFLRPVPTRAGEAGAAAARAVAVAHAQGALPFERRAQELLDDLEGLHGRT